MNYAAATTKTITRVFNESQVPAHLKDEVLRIKTSATKLQKQPPKPVPSPVKEVPKSPRPEFLEPISPPPASTSNLLQEYQRKNMEEYLRWEIQQPSTWLRQIEVLENQRSKITRKGKLSANDLNELEEIDEKIKYCEDTLNDLENDYFEDSE